MEIKNAVVLILVFLAIVLFMEAVYFWAENRYGKRSQNIKRRLASMDNFGTQQSSIGLLRNRKLSNIQFLNDGLSLIPDIEKLDRFLLQTGEGWFVDKFLLIGLCVAAVFAILFNYIDFPFGFASGAVVGLFMFVLLTMNMKLKRLTKIETQLPDALDLIARALRAGHAFNSALQMGARELPQPIGSEFQMTYDEINFGISTDVALKNLAERVDSPDLRLFVIAMLIQKDTGGNVAELLDKLSSVVRDRQVLKKKIQVLSAEGRMSAGILTALPFLVAGAMFATNKDFVEILWVDEFGRQLVAGALTMMLAGIFIMWRMARIRV